MSQMETRRMCPHCRAFITTSDRVCPYCNEKVGPRAIDRRSPSPILGFIPHAQFVTSVILLINIAIFIASMLNRGLFDAGAKARFEIQQGQWWRLVTAGFLHGGFFHILMNSWVLFDVGAQVEQIYGASRMLVIYFVSTITGFYLSYLLTPNPSVGASAAIMGLIGAMIAVSVHHRNALTQAMRGTYIRWVIYMLVIGFIVSGIDNYAHIGGLAGGFAVAYFAGLPRWDGSPLEQGWRVASYICIGLTALCFFDMYRWFTRGGGLF
jgi:rhomboid protease GluP